MPRPSLQAKQISIARPHRVAPEENVLVTDLMWIPEDVRQWADENMALLDIVAADLLRTGRWPSVAALTRRLAREGRPAPVAHILWQMPRILGFVDTSPDQVVLLLLALRMTEAGRPLLEGFLKVLTLARARYRGDDENPEIHRDDVGQLAEGDDAFLRALSEVVLREAPFIGSGTGSVGDDWRREITDGIVRYWDVRSPDDYLRVRAAELRAGAALSLGPVPVANELGEADEAYDPLPAQPPGSSVQSDDRDAFISHAGEDIEVAEGVGDLLTAAGWNIWLDKLEMTVGDTLTVSLNDALARSRFGVVILSPAFFAKHWPQQELAALGAKEATSGTKVILPVWHGIDENYLAEVAPMLASRIGVSTDQGLSHVARELIRALEKNRAAPRDPARTDPVVQSVISERERDSQAPEQGTSSAGIDAFHEGVPPWMVPRLVRWLEPFLISSDDLGERFPIPEFIESLESRLRLSVPIDRGDVIGDVKHRIEQDPDFGISAIRYVLSTMRVVRTPTHEVTNRHLPALERMLDESGSVWEVSELDVEGGIEGEKQLTLRRRDASGGNAS